MRLFLSMLISIIFYSFSTKCYASLRLNFLLDDAYVICHTLYVTQLFHNLEVEVEEDLKRFKEAVDTQISEEEIEALLKVDDILEHESSILADFFSWVKELTEYQVIREQVEDYIQLTQLRWEESYPICLPLMEELTGISFDATFSVFITHPGLGNGYSQKPQRIFWGGQECWPYYTVVYLWHEILHDYFDYSGTSHAVIQLLTDNELQKKLNGESYPPYEGHPDLIPQMEAYQFDWEVYLMNDEKDIFIFIDQMKEKYPELVEHPNLY